MEVNFHRGFLASVIRGHSGLDLFENLKNCIIKGWREGAKKRKVIATGHSLGGALAKISAYYMSYDDESIIDRVYTYGAPMIGGGLPGTNRHKRFK